MQPGGHADGDIDCLAVATKEVSEETGLREFSVIEGVFDVDIHRIPARRDEAAHLHYDVRYAFHQQYAQTPIGNHESIELKWFPVSQVATWSEPSLARMARKWMARKS